MNTTENNKLIAEFMGFNLAEEIAPKLYINSKEKKQMYLRQMVYHSSWDWLMKVVEKIEALENGVYSLSIEKDFCQILENREFSNEIVSIDGSNKLEAVFCACVSFVKWHNIQKELCKK